MHPCDPRRCAYTCVYTRPAHVRALHTDVTEAEVTAGMLPMLCARRRDGVPRFEQCAANKLHVGQKGRKMQPLVGRCASEEDASSSPAPPPAPRRHVFRSAVNFKFSPNRGFNLQSRGGSGSCEASPGETSRGPAFAVGEGHRGEGGGGSLHVL